MLTNDSQPMPVFKFYDWVVAGFIAILLLSNLASSAKIIDLGLSLGPLPLVFDAGTLFFPIGYIFSDVLAEVYGYRYARRVIWAGFASSALLAAGLWIVEVLPGEAAWQQYAGQSAYDAILGGVFGLSLASLLAYLAGAFTNAIVMVRLKALTEGRMLWLRTIGSTLFGQAVDTTLFIVIAAVLGVFPWQIVVSLIVANYIFKVVIEVAMTPVTYQVIGALKKAEEYDPFDIETDLNPFKLGA